MPIVVRTGRRVVAIDVALNPGVAVVLRHILRNEDAQPIRSMVPSLWVDLLVQPDEVHPKVAQHGHVGDQRRLPRRGVLTVRPIRLVEEAREEAPLT